MKNNKILKLFLTVTFTILASSNMLLAKHVDNKEGGDPPKFVYRMDTRGDLDATKNVIFKNGFSSWGENTNLLVHVYGGTKGIYIATTSSMQVANNFAKTPGIYIDLGKGYPPRLYRYTIRADSNFYDASISAQQYIEDSWEGVVEIEKEWVAVHHIPASQVYSVTVYNLDRSKGIYVISDIVMLNTHYEDIPSTGGNPDPYHGIVAAVNTKTATVVTDLSYKKIFGLGFCPSPYLKLNRDIVNYGIKGSCAYPLILSIKHWSEELKAYKNYILSNKLGYIKAQSHDEL